MFPSRFHKARRIRCIPTSKVAELVGLPIDALLDYDVDSPYYSESKTKAIAAVLDVSVAFLRDKDFFAKAKVKGCTPELLASMTSTECIICRELTSDQYDSKKDFVVEGRIQQESLTEQLRKSEEKNALVSQLSQIENQKSLVAYLKKNRDCALIDELYKHVKFNPWLSISQRISVPTYRKLLLMEGIEAAKSKSELMTEAVDKEFKRLRLIGYRLT